MTEEVAVSLRGLAEALSKQCREPQGWEQLPWIRLGPAGGRLCLSVALSSYTACPLSTQKLV